MPYKPHPCLISAWRKHECTTVHSCLSAYKAWVGRFSTDVRLYSKSSHVACRTKSYGLDPPKRTNSLCGKLPHKKALLRAMPIKSIVRSGVGWDWLGHVSNPTPAWFCYPCAGHASTTTTCHMCSSGTLMLAPSAYNAWVERFSCRCEIALKVFPCCLQNKTMQAWLPKADKQLVQEITL